MNAEERLPLLTRCGLPGVEVIPYGIHACHVYRDADELLATLLPYFRAGLDANERCLWITADELPAEAASRALRLAWSDADELLRSDRLRILDVERWYPRAGALEASDLVELWLGEEARALADGHTGLRISGNMSFIRPADWPKYMAYEREVDARFTGRRIVALCSYVQPQCRGPAMHHVLDAHQCAFERTDSGWQVDVRLGPQRRTSAVE